MGDDGGDVVRGIPVDDLGRARVFTPLSVARPWFRAFHASWMSFFLAFLGWFALAPALPYLVEQPGNGIDENVRRTSDIVAVLGTVFLRIASGPLLESYGPRRLQASLLVFGGVVVMLAALVNSAPGLYAVRFAISFVGAAFVPCQFWTSIMFSSDVVGQANAVAGGWGNLGGGAAPLLMGALIQAFQEVFDDDKAWRVAIVVPGALLLLGALPTWLLADDCPQGLWRKRLYNMPRPESEAESEEAREQVEPSGEDQPAGARSFQQAPASGAAEGSGPAPKGAKPNAAGLRAWVSWPVWVLFVQYGCCFGVELAINNSLPNYLYQRFVIDGSVGNVDCATNPFRPDGAFEPGCSVLGKNRAAMIAALFGLQNLYARALGGLLSDRLNRLRGPAGRLATQLTCLLGQGVALMVFSRTRTLGISLFCLIVFSIFVQASEGSTFALVPLSHRNVGVVAGLVGAGGNVGAVLWATTFRAVPDMSTGYLYVGAAVFFSAWLVLPLPLQGASLLSSWCGGATWAAPTDPGKSSEGHQLDRRDDDDECHEMPTVELART